MESDRAKDTHNESSDTSDRRQMAMSFSARAFSFSSITSSSNALSFYIEINVRILTWKSRPARGRNQAAELRTQLSSRLCVHRESVAFIKSSMRMWSNCTKLSINNEPWKRWWQSLYATMHVRCSRSFAWSPISLCSGALVSSLVRSIHAIRSHFTAWLKTNTVRLTIWTALGKNSIYNASNKICSF